VLGLLCLFKYQPIALKLAISALGLNFLGGGTVFCLVPMAPYILVTSMKEERLNVAGVRVGNGCRVPPEMMQVLETICLNKLRTISCNDCHVKYIKYLEIASFCL